MLARNTDDATAQLVKVNAWKWAAAKRNPRIYADKIDMTHSGVVGVASLPIDMESLTAEQRETVRDVLLLASPRGAKPEAPEDA
jgi:hypothetical protein